MKKNMKGDRATTRSKLARCIKASIRVLSKARDLYVKSLTDCSDRMPYGAATGFPAGVVYSLPQSFSLNSSTSKKDEDEDLLLLMHALSKNSTHEMEDATPTQTCRSKGLHKNSYSVGVLWRIDEDNPCNFNEDFRVASDNNVL